MKKQFYWIVLASLLLTWCNSETNNNESYKEEIWIDIKEIPEPKIAPEITNISDTLNSKMLIFSERMEKYLKTNKKDVWELEKLHLDFVPILWWKEFEWDEEYKKLALSAWTIVHKLKELNWEEYNEMLTTLKPAYTKFYTKYWNK